MTPKQNFKLNDKFNDIVNWTVSKIIDYSLMDCGYLSPVMDSLNDMVQHCDQKGLQSNLYVLYTSVIGLMTNDIITRSPAEKEILVNNFGGFIQIILVGLKDMVDQ